VEDGALRRVHAERDCRASAGRDCGTGHEKAPLKHRGLSGVPVTRGRKYRCINSRCPAVSKACCDDPLRRVEFVTL
jgi:hypothetical protein